MNPLAWLKQPMNAANRAGLSINPVRAGIFGAALSVPIVSYQASKAEKGETIPYLEAGATFPLLTGAMAAGIGWALPALRFATPAAAPIAAAMFAMSPGLSRGGIYRGFRQMTHLDEQVRRLEMGGDFQDSEIAQNLRLNAVRDMSGAIQPARRWLGREAAFLHR